MLSLFLEYAIGLAPLRPIRVLMEIAALAVAVILKFFIPAGLHIGSAGSDSRPRRFTGRTRRLLKIVASMDS
jgi:hypothetical protein